MESPEKDPLRVEPLVVEMCRLGQVSDARAEDVHRVWVRQPPGTRAVSLSSPPLGCGRSRRVDATQAQPEPFDDDVAAAELANLFGKSREPRRNRTFNPQIKRCLRRPSRGSHRVAPCHFPKKFGRSGPGWTVWTRKKPARKSARISDLIGVRLRVRSCFVSPSAVEGDRLEGFGL